MSYRVRQSNNGTWPQSPDLGRGKGVVKEGTNYMYFECRHIMPNGARCHSPALRGLDFCYYHTRLHRLARPVQPKAKPADVQPSAEAFDPVKLPFLEDRSAIQVALSQILDALSTGKLQPKQASILLYGLQIASQNVERKQDILPFKAVESVSRSRNGDELAPKLRVCEPSDTCSTCDERDTCPNFEPADDSADA